MVSTANALELDNVSLGYSNRPAVSNITLAIKKGEFVGVIGPNGSGKSTLIKGILGTIKPQRGQISVLGYTGSEIIKARPFLGYVPQRNQVDRRFPATVNDVVLMGIYGKIGLFRRPGRDDYKRVGKVLAEVGMEQFGTRPIGQLSGGQLQRVLIARALVSDPQVLLLDEPTSAVDVSAEQGILNLLDEINKSRGITIIMVTHNVNEIVHLAHQLVLLNGKLEAYGSPAEVLSAETIARVFGGFVQV